MDFLSIILAAIGWGREDAAKAAEKKMEAYRLNAEVAGECLRAISILDMAKPNLVCRLQALFPDKPETFQSCGDALAILRSQYQQLYDMAETNKAAIDSAGQWVDWDKGIRAAYQWRVTASGFVPHIETAIRQFEAIVLQGEQRQQNATSPPPSFPSQRDRGWDAPPL